MRASSKASQNEDILDVVNQKITKEVDKYSLQNDKIVQSQPKNKEDLSPLNKSFAKQLQDTKDQQSAMTRNHKGVELKSQGTELGQSQVQYSQYPQSPNQEEIKEMFKTHISLQKPKQIDVKVTQPTLQSPLGWQPVKMSDKQQVQPVFKNMVLTPNTANNAAASKIGNYPNIDAIFKNAKKSERNHDHLGALKGKSKNSTISSKKASTKVVKEQSPTSKGGSFAQQNQSQLRTNSKESIRAAEGTKGGMVFNDKNFQKQKMFMEMMQTAGINTLQSPENADYNQMSSCKFNESQLLVQGQHLMNKKSLRVQQLNKDIRKHQNQIAYEQQSQASRQGKNIQSFENPVMQVKIGDKSVPISMEILDQIQQIDSKLMSHNNSTQEPAHADHKGNPQETTENTQVTLVDPMMLSFLSFEKHRMNKNDPLAQLNMQKIIQRQQSLEGQSSPNDEEASQRRIINTALFQNGVHEEDMTVESPSPLKMPFEGRNYNSQLRSSKKGMESFANRHKSVTNTTDYAFDLQAPQQYGRRNQNSNGKKDPQFKISVQGVPSQITKFRIGSTRSSKNSGEDFVGNRSFRNSIETENVGGPNRSMDKKRGSYETNNINIQRQSLEHNSTHKKINEEIQQFISQNGKQPEQTSSIDQNTIPMDFKAYQVITEDTQQSIAEPRQLYMESEFLQSQKYKAFQKMNAKSAMAAKKFKNQRRIQELKKTKYNQYKVKSLSPKSQNNSQVTTPKAKPPKKDKEERRPSQVARRPSQITLLAQVPKVDELVHTAKISHNEGVATKPGSNLMTMTLRDKLASQRSQHKPKAKSGGQRTTSQPIYQQITQHQIEGIPSMVQDKSSKDKTSRKESSAPPSQLVSPKPRINCPIYFSSNTRNHVSTTGDRGIGVQGYSLLNQNINDQHHVESQKLQAKYPHQYSNSGATTNPYAGVTPPIDTQQTAQLSKRVKLSSMQVINTKETEGRDNSRGSKETVHNIVEAPTMNQCDTEKLKDQNSKILRMSHDQVFSENSQAYIMQGISRDINENQNNTELRNSTDSQPQMQNKVNKNQKDHQSQNLLENTEQTEINANESQEYGVDAFATANEGQISATHEGLASANSHEGETEVHPKESGSDFIEKLQSFSPNKNTEQEKQAEDINDNASTVRINNKSEMRMVDNVSDLIKPQRVIVQENDVEEENDIFIQHQKTGEQTVISDAKEPTLVHNDSNYLPYSYEPHQHKLQFKKVKGTASNITVNKNSNKIQVQQNRTQILSKDSNSKKVSIETNQEAQSSSIQNRTNLAMISEMQMSPEIKDNVVLSNIQQLRGGPRLIQSQQGYRKKSKLSSQIASSQDYVSENLNIPADYHNTEPTFEENVNGINQQIVGQDIYSQQNTRVSPESGKNFIAITFNESLGNIYRQSNLSGLQLRPSSLGAIDYSSIGSNISQLSIKQGDYMENRSQIRHSEFKDFEKFTGINVGTGRLRDRLMNTSTDYRLINKAKMDKQRFLKTNAVFKQQNISSLGQTGVDMQAHGKLDLILGQKSYDNFINSRNDLLSQVILQKCKMPPDLPNPDIVRMDYVNGQNISSDTITDVQSVAAYFDSRNQQSRMSGLDTFSNDFGRKSSHVQSRVSQYLSNNQNYRRFNFSSAQVNDNGKQTHQRQLTSSSAATSSVGLPNFARNSQFKVFNQKRHSKQRSQNFALIQNVAANERVKIQKFEKHKIQSLINQNMNLEGKSPSQHKSNLILLNKDMVQQGAKVKYKLPEGTFDNYLKHKKSLGQMRSKEQKILYILQN